LFVLNKKRNTWWYFCLGKKVLFSTKVWLDELILEKFLKIVSILGGDGTTSPTMFDAVRQSLQG